MTSEPSSVPSPKVVPSWLPAGVWTVLEFFLRDLRLKILALIITAVLFVVTRDEVTRGFSVPLRVVEDPDRVLLTELPSTIRVQVRGPWTRVNRLAAYDLGPVTLDLRHADPGPLAIERGAVVMPPGVLLADLKYDPVDLRFDPVERFDVPVVVALEGDVHPDFEVRSIETTPGVWPVRAARSRLREVSEVTTIPVAVAGMQQSIDTQVLVLPPPGIELVAVSGATPAVQVNVEIEPRVDVRTMTLPIEVDDQLDPAGVVPKSVEVSVRGPRPAFRQLDGLGLSPVLHADLNVVRAVPTQPGIVEVVVTWVEQVPAAVRDTLIVEPRRQEIVLPPLPAPVPAQEPFSDELPPGAPVEEGD